MTDRTVSADEFHRSINDLRAYMGERCDGIDGRLDRVNGQLDRHAAAIGRIDPMVARHDERLDELKRGAQLDQPIPAELRELIELARDAKGIARVTRWLWALGVVVAPLVLWWLSKKDIWP
jgi:hypothetical protein